MVGEAKHTFIECTPASCQNSEGGNISKIVRLIARGGRLLEVEYTGGRRTRARCIVEFLLWAYFGYLDRRVTFCLLARMAGIPKLGLAPLPNPLRVGHTTIIVG